MALLDLSLEICFIKKNIKLEETVLKIKEINGISRWITTEYYGETIYSLKEYEEQAKQVDSSRLVRYAEIDSLHLFYTWKDSAENFYTYWHHTLALSELSYEQYKDTGNILKTPLFQDLHFLLGYKKEKKTYKFIQKHPLHSRKYRNKFRKVLAKKEEQLLGNPKKDLVLMGRGWVKAGFNLEEIQEDQVRVEQKEDTLFLKGMPDPYIITSSINPWFIPDKLKGYEIVFKQGGRKLTSEDVKLVKAGCLDKLEKDARESGILELAWESAERSILSMIKIMGEEEITNVILVR